MFGVGGEERRRDNGRGRGRGRRRGRGGGGSGFGVEYSLSEKFFWRGGEGGERREKGEKRGNKNMDQNIYLCYFLNVKKKGIPVLGYLHLANNNSNTSGEGKGGGHNNFLFEKRVMLIAFANFSFVCEVSQANWWIVPVFFGGVGVVR